ncbi:MAG: hypothetical protein M0Z42_01660 [Actinomycetota bacterium]|jgi:hypothetical protein|nr:hypothetical protein [Actinomycetota bacterium]
MFRLLYSAFLVLAFVLLKSAAVAEAHHVLAAIVSALHVPAQ